MNTQRIFLLGLTCLATNSVKAADFSFLDSKDFLADSAALCQVAYKDEDQLTEDCREHLSMRKHIDVDSIAAFGNDVAGGVTANFELKGDSYQLVAFMGTNGLGQAAEYFDNLTFPYHPANEIFRSHPFGETGAGSFGVVSNFWRNYCESEWTFDSLDPDVPVIFMGHSRGGAVADIAAWHTATLRGVEAENLARGYRDIATVTFAQPAVFTSELARFTDRFIEDRSLKVGFENEEDWIYKKFHNHLTYSIEEAEKHRNAMTTLDEDFFGRTPPLIQAYLRLHPTPCRTKFSMSGNLIEIDAPGGHGIENYAEYFGVEITKPQPPRGNRGKPGRARPAKEELQYEVEGGSDDDVEVEEEEGEESAHDEEEESSEDDE